MGKADIAICLKKKKKNIKKIILRLKKSQYNKEQNSFLVMI